MFRSLIWIIKLHPRGWIGALILATISAGVELIAAFLIFALLSAVVAPGAIESSSLGRFDATAWLDHAWALPAILLFFLARTLLYILQLRTQNAAAQRTGVLLATSIFERHLRLPIERLSTKSSSELVRNAYSAVSEVVTGALVPAVVLVSEGAAALGLLLALSIASPGITVGTVAVFLILGAGTLKILQPRLLRLGEQTHSQNQLLLRQLQQGFQGLREIRLAGAEGEFLRTFEANRAQLAENYTSRAVLSETPRALLELILVLGIVLTVALVSTSAVSRSLLAVAGLFGYSALRLLPSINRILAALNSLKFAAASVDSVYRDLQVVYDEIEESDLPLATPEEVRFENVGYSYPNAEPVLEGVSFSLLPRQLIGVVGASGSGKSTLLDLLSGLLTPVTGEVLISGINLSDVRTHWQSKIGFVSQKPFLLDATVQENVAFGRPASDVDEGLLLKSLWASDLSGFVASLPQGIHTPIGEEGIRFSGGQRQRLALARALYRDPWLLVLDEATSAVDKETEARILARIFEMSSDRIVVMVTHRPEVLRSADAILLLDRGALVEVGSYQELYSRNQLFRRLSTSDE